MEKHLRYLLLFAIIFAVCVLVNGWSKNEMPKGGLPSSPKTLGQVWPLPQHMNQGITYLTIDQQTFQLNYNGIPCEIINAAISRYNEIIFNPPRFAGYSDIQNLFDAGNYHGVLAELQLSLTGNCEILPHPEMDESYTLKVDTEDALRSAQLNSNSTWGILKGLETFSQLIYHDDSRNFYINSTAIIDFPRFSFRGFLLDTSRHYITTDAIKQHLDAMAYNKLNVFHWHMTDDQSFPYQSQRFPSLSDEGAYNPITHIYTFDDIRSIISYAADRGIRVIPEFDTPGHTKSWGYGMPGLLTECYEGDKPVRNYGPIDPTKEENYQFIKELFTEVAELFPDKYQHLGGDEVPYTCWASNPNITEFMNEMGFGDNYALLESYYLNNLLQIFQTIPNSKGSIVWQEVFNKGCEISDDTIVNVWKEIFYESEMYNVTEQGYHAILSSCWYLNYISYGPDWEKYYNCEPLSFSGTEEQYDLVLGGTGCMWGEMVDATNLISRTWPRASAIAERLWSDRYAANDTSLAAPRLEEHRCRMVERNINAEPLDGPNYCPSDYLLS
ncbi:hypothetical protein CHUAL_009954 [Chamberlinius hualienensis]